MFARPAIKVKNVKLPHVNVKIYVKMAETVQISKLRRQSSLNVSAKKGILGNFVKLHLAQEKSA